ncbi:MAG: galactokinase [Ruminococcaceae bacterium]|nr:galactokinase [Oscillospiraceae bacterium]
MKIKQLIKTIQDGGLDTQLIKLYGERKTLAQRERYLKAINEFIALYGDEHDVNLFSVSGRSELSGNHTDHNRGYVIAASIDLDIIAIAAKTDDRIIRVKSSGHRADCVDIDNFTQPCPDLYGRSCSIIAGMCNGMLAQGHKVGGFIAYTTSDVPGGSGISSSAAFEDMIGTIINHFYNDGKIDVVEIAKISQYAENKFFGKPCGLMDQVACAVGGIVAIDFEDTSAPIIEPIDFDISAQGFNLCIVNTGGNHADLTDDYTSVPAEMKAVAAFFGKEVLRELDENTIIDNIVSLREAVGDRAILRSLHFFEENKRVSAQKQALKNGDVSTFFENVKASGRSSFCYLQNVYTSKNLTEQGLSLALCIADKLLSEKNAAWRVHGGGFAGTIQAFVHKNDVETFKKTMDACFGEGACLVLRIRPIGATKIL